MLYSIFESPFTYTTSRVHQVLEGDRDDAESTDRSTRAEFTVNPIGYRTEYRDTRVIHHFATAESHQSQAAAWCQQCLDALDDTPRHVEIMDEVFSRLAICHFRPRRPIHEIAEDASHMLSRLPSIPLEIRETSISSSLSRVPEGFFLAGRERKWATLRVVQHVTRNIIRVALLPVMSNAGDSIASQVHSLGEAIAELFTYSLKIRKGTDRSCGWKTFLLKAFLWTQWQRCVMLNSWIVLKDQLKNGFNTDLSSLTLVSRMTADLLKPSNCLSGESAIEIVPPQPVPYVCKWALRLLQTDRASISLDFRRLFARYAELFGQLSPRCNRLDNGDIAQCAGDTLYNCNRFVGMKIDDQTTHAKSCGGMCNRLHWDENSYRNTEGARAVSLYQADNGLLKYCTASHGTMAISHVWSHGQGGRPEIEESGLNRCLHERYVKIAHGYSCDSYWMDTPCIPKDRILRDEAIEHINSVFANSKLTLVCDRDLMSINVNEMSIALQESILASVLLCDWNVRAWTLLEALRGRKNIQILCANDQTVSLRDMLQNVHREGSIDIATFFLTAQHLLPAALNPPGRNANKYWYLNETEANGALSMEQAASLLHLRHASRPGDEIVIWSLLCNDKPPRSKSDRSVLRDLHLVSDTNVHETTAEVPNGDPSLLLAEAFWKMKVGYMLKTGFLMSSAPRDIQRKGWRWAPSRPALPPPRPNGLENEGPVVSESYMPFDGQSTEGGTITPWGYMAKWLTHIFRIAKPPSKYKKLTHFQSMTSAKKFHAGQARISWISETFLQDDDWGALLQPVDSLGLPARYRGPAAGTLLAVVGSSDRSVWRWRGLYDWDGSVPVPELEEEEIVLV
ncbi:hypothetical protein BP5796_11976 [Coleophoma crateriformis]|uniref:Heterokaryon incompatibility domain-containing protein n=1 Tax=Coleophoma crateriformis TaxID=565419 RepID=A0A3D8QB32_9HELO|nr:hypothetical protein BP5796_11976 [Coleophoma crateriformis]